MIARLRLALLAAAVCLGLAAPASAQPPRGTVTMTTDSAEAQVGETIVLRIRVNAVVSGQADLRLPDLSEFDVLQYPMTPRTSFGGNAQTQMSMSYNVPIRARRPGTFRIAPAALVTAAGRLESQPLTITVSGTPPPDPTGPPAVGVGGTVFDPSGFVRTVVDRSDPYVGQQVTVTVYLYARDMHGGLTITQEPSTDGFWVHDLLDPARSSLEPRLVTERGIPFNVVVLRRFAAFPLREGELTIGPTSVTISGGGVFSVFGMGGPTVSRTGVPVTIQARPLPSAGRPDGNVHVGSLTLSAALDRTQAATGDAVQLTVTARGTGQVQQVQLPTPAVDGLRVLEPEIDDDIRPENDLVGGARVFRWLVVPEREGTYTLGPFEVPTFDPASGTYSVARAAAVRLTAAGNPTSAAEPEDPREEDGADEGSSEDALTLGPVRSRSALLRARETLLDAPWLPWAFGFGPLVFVAALVARAARKRSEAGNGQGPKRARREAKRRLSEASRHASASQPREFYAAVAQALKEVLEAKLGRAVGSLTHPELRRELGTRGMDEELAARVVDELEGCDFARFSAAGVKAEEMERCLERTKGLLEELERFSPSAEEEA